MLSNYYVFTFWDALRQNYNHGIYVILARDDSFLNLFTRHHLNIIQNILRTHWQYNLFATTKFSSASSVYFHVWVKINLNICESYAHTLDALPH